MTPLRDLKHLKPYDPLQEVASRVCQRIYNAVAIPTWILAITLVMNELVRFGQ